MDSLILEWENSWQKAWVGRICLYPPFQGLKARGEAEQGVISAQHTPIVSPRLIDALCRTYSRVNVTHKAN